MGSTLDQSADVFGELAQIVGSENATREQCDLVCYEKDFSVHSASPRSLPDFVVQPATNDQVSAVVKLANRHRMPLVPRGGGTGMWGGAVPAHRGILLDMRKMDRILEVDEEKRLVTVQAGVLVRALAVYLEKRGFFLADKPESWFSATIGARTQSNGIGYLYNSRYGQSVDQIVCLVVVLPTGEVIRTGPPKIYDPASGYDLTRLFSCAEGTLGIVTEVTFRIYKLPEHRALRCLEFPSYQDMTGAVAAIRDSGLVPETIETMDGISYRLYVKGTNAGKASSRRISRAMGAMVIGYAGIKKTAEAQIDWTQEICARFHGTPAPDGCVEAWTAFRETYPVNPFPLHSALKKKPVKYILDATVHLESTSDVVRTYHDLLDKYGIESHGLVAVHCAPDFHAVLYAQAYVDERNEKEVQTFQQMQDEIHNYVISIGGGIGGAGGIGLMRMEYGKSQYASALDLMRRLKQALDPNNIMNPGKKLGGE
jgi:glycolate oxidase